MVGMGGPECSQGLHQKCKAWGGGSSYFKCSLLEGENVQVEKFERVERWRNLLLRLCHERFYFSCICHNTQPLLLCLFRAHLMEWLVLEYIYSLPLCFLVSNTDVFNFCSEFSSEWFWHSELWYMYFVLCYNVFKGYLTVVDKLHILCFSCLEKLRFWWANKHYKYVNVPRNPGQGFQR